MKGPLIKSGERAQGRLILPLIRPDKAGAGQERGVLEPTAQPGFNRVLGRGTTCHHPLTCLHCPWG